MSGENTTNIKTNTPITNEEASSVYSGMNQVFEHTKCIIDTMKQGERIGIRDLADKVAAKVEMSNSNVMNLVQLFCKRSKEVTVEVGRCGGVFKGGKLKRTDQRKRCETCHQVIREAKEKQSTPNLDLMDTEPESKDFSEIEENVT